MTRSSRRAILAVLVALALMAGAFFVSRPTGQPAADGIAVPAADGTALPVAEECQRALGYPARTAADRTWLRQCVHALTPPTDTPTPTPTVVPTTPTHGSTSTAPPTTAPPTTPAPTTVPPTTPAPTSGPPLNCAPQPSRCGYPDATNTGVPAGTALTVTAGRTITTAGTTIDGEDIRGCIVIAAANVTIRRSKITCTDAWVVRSYRGDYTAGGLVIEDSEISCGGSQGTGIASYGFTVRRVEVRDCENGFAIDNDVTVEDSYVHGLYIGSGGHTDGAQMAGGVHITMRHNTILNDNDGGTSAIIMNETGESDVLISDNLMAGGAFTLYCPKTSSSNVRVLDNRFSRLYKPKGGEYGPWVYCGQVAQVSGNVWDDTGALVPV